MPSLNVRYSRPLAITFIVLGALLALVSLGTKGVASGVAGVILLVLGVLQLRAPMVVVADGEVQLRNPLGMTVKRFPVNSLADLRMEGKSLMHLPSGKKITSVGFGFDKNDVAALRAQLSGQPLQQGQAPQGQPWGPPQPGQPMPGQVPQGQQWGPPQQGQPMPGQVPQGQQWAPPQQGQAPQGQPWGPPQQGQAPQGQPWAPPQQGQAPQAPPQQGPPPRQGS